MSKKDEVSFDQQNQLANFAQTMEEQDRESHVIERAPAWLLNATLYVLLGVIATALVVAFVGKVDIIVTAPGKVEPEGAVVRIHALHDGVVAAVSATPGQHLEKGAEILVQEAGAIGVELDQQQKLLALKGAELKRIRAAHVILSELVAAPELPDDFPTRLNRLAELGEGVESINQVRLAYQEVFNASQWLQDDLPREQERLEAKIALREKHIAALAQEVRVLRDELRGQEEISAIFQEQFDDISDLAAKGLATQPQVNQRREQLTAARQDINRLKRELAEKRLSSVENELEIEQLSDDFLKEFDARQEALEQSVLKLEQDRSLLANFQAQLTNRIADLEAAYEDLNSAVELKENQLALRQIVMPVSGVIIQMGVNSPGLQLRQGEEVAQIIPDTAAQIVTLTVSNKDIGFVRPGIPARVKLDAYPFHRFGSVPATVTQVFPISGEPDFRVDLALESPTIDIDGRPVPIYAGLTTEVDLITGRSRIIELFIQTSRRLLGEATDS